jgi:hypothetical protein
MLTTKTINVRLAETATDLFGVGKKEVNLKNSRIAAGCFSILAPEYLLLLILRLIPTAQPFIIMLNCKSVMTQASGASSSHMILLQTHDTTTSRYAALHA